MASDFASSLEGFILRGQHPSDRALTRYKYDVCKMVENNEISTGPGRWALGVPNAYGNATFVPDPTIRMQKWGASHDMSSTKTDVESDLRNLSRPTTRTVCGQYDPSTAPTRHLTAMPEADFPQTHNRVSDPPCTLRGTGWNRWAWLCQDPQERAMMPFEWGANSQLAAKDGVDLNTVACSPTDVTPSLPVPRRPGHKDVQDATNVLPGAGRMGSVPVMQERMRWSTPQVATHPDAPPSQPSRGANLLEIERRTTGRLAPPPPFA